MKHYLLVTLIISATGNLLAQDLAPEVSSNDPQDQFVVTEDPASSDGSSPSLGLAVGVLSSMGITYKRPINKSAVFWVAGSYGFRDHLYEERLNSGMAHGALLADQSRRYQLAAGIDQHLSLFGLKDHYFVVGVGMGINRTEIEATYYKEMCNIICGFDPNSGIQRQERDIYGFFLGRMGVLGKDRNFWGTKADIGLYWNPFIARWNSEYRFKNPHSGHTDYSLTDKTFMQVEATFHL